MEVLPTMLEVIGKQYHADYYRIWDLWRATDVR